MKMFLSQITLDKANALKLRIFDSYRYHQLLWQAFPDTPEAKRDFIFRVDDFDSAYRIFMLSARRPSLPAWGQWQTKEINEKFLSHRNYRFELRANPTTRIKKPEGKKNGALRPITEDDELKKWFLRQSENNGFKIHGDCFSFMPPVTQPFSKDNARAVINQVDFSGVIEVTDRAKFTDAFATGIGRARSLGFGMLVISPVN